MRSGDGEGGSAQDADDNSEHDDGTRWECKQRARRRRWVAARAAAEAWPTATVHGRDAVTTTTACVDAGQDDAGGQARAGMIIAGGGRGRSGCEDGEPGNGAHNDGGCDGSSRNDRSRDNSGRDEGRARRQQAC